MILGVDGHRLLGVRSGVARVLEDLLIQLDQIGHPFDAIRLYSPAPVKDAVSLGARVHNVVLRGARSMALWQQFALPRAHGRAGLLLCPNYTLPLLVRSPTLLIHHGSYEGCPEAFPWHQRLRSGLLYGSSAWRASSVITVSEHSRRQMCHFYRLPESRIRVIPNGVDLQRFYPADEPEAGRAWRTGRLGDDRPWVLYVGNNNPRRRLSALVRAFALLVAEHELPHRLIFVGFEIEGTEVLEAARRTGILDRVHSLGHLESEEVAHCYRASDVMAYPSIDEGFGLPVLEAMACGTPVLALDRAAFPEFAAEAALLLPDAEVSTLRHGLETLLLDPSRRAAMRREGKERAVQYAWPGIAQQYLDAMLSTLEEGERKPA